MRAPVFLLAVVVVLSGCTGGKGGDGAEDGPGTGPNVAVTDTTGAISGIVVDERITPIEGARVLLSGAGVQRNATSDVEGRFVFDTLLPATYLLSATSLLHQQAQTSVDVVAGRAPPVTKILLTRLFAQDPYHETLKFDGFIQCGWAAGGSSSVCVNDYTHFTPLGYTCPECEHLVDNRGTNFPLGAGWQTLVFEMTWDPSAQGTSPEMRLTISHFPRLATHWYCSGTGPSPLYVRAEVGVECEEQQDEPTLIPAEGETNMTLFAAAQPADGQPAAVAFSQPFSVFMNFFYYGKPPEGWSFVHGDAFPF